MSRRYALLHAGDRSLRLASRTCALNAHRLLMGSARCKLTKAALFAGHAHAD